MGLSGTDVALETADVVLTTDDLEKIPYAVALGRQALRVVKPNLVLDLGMIVVLVVSDLFGRISLPWVWSVSFSSAPRNMGRRTADALARSWRHLT